MGRWLEKVRNAEVDTPRKPPKSPLGGLEGVAGDAFSEKNEDGAPVTTTDWVEWITERCPLLPEDKAHVSRGLFRLHPRLQQRLAERYAETWRRGHDAEQSAVKQENAGRRAANIIITKLLKGDEHV
ncbi:hypothetical protein R5R73_07415 [Salinicola sp. LHM]|uniref:hypothetical protein n=1 Tax=Salinicola sp. LHM TaxID=3065298 RepID=UPI002ACEBAA6|nr:hypothetical protein [Salinicola sp. LHM]WQH34507.1 hypothetical protein R5R73_07415 [Salinicola sp. LHM]